MRIVCILVVILLMLSGCGVSTLVRGEYFLRQEKYEEGLEKFRNRIQRNPSDSAAHYYLGRYLLSLDRPGEARSHLERAVSLNSSKTQHHFWLGVCYQALKKPELERGSYLKALQLDSRHLRSRLFLGHSYLEQDRWGMALEAYGRVLQLRSNHPQALYNRGLALQNLRRGPEEIEAWKEYLKYYPEGKWAIRAVDHLNARSDFAYRNYSIGYRRVPLEQIRFKDLTWELEESAKPSLDVVGSILSINKKIHLKIIGYRRGDQNLAQKRAESVRRYLTVNFTDLDPGNLTVKGVGRPEKVAAGSRVYSLDEALNFLTVKR